MPLTIIAGPGSRHYVAAGGGGGDNPDGYANYTTLYREATFPNSSTDAPFNQNGNLVTQTYLSAGGYQGGPAWQFEFDQNTGDPEGTESQSGHGFKWWAATGNNPDDTPILCVGGRFWLSQKLIDEAMNTGQTWFGGKIVDMRCWAEDGNSAPIGTRQILGWCPVRTAEAGIFSATGVTCPAGLYMSCVNGGAGGQWCYDGTNAPYDLSEHAEEWIEWRAIFDTVGQRTLLYFKSETDAVMTRSCVRDADDRTGNFDGLPADEACYVFTSRGWCMDVDATPTSQYDSIHMAYWQGMRYTFTPLPSMKFDHIVTANGWIPFTI